MTLLHNDAPPQEYRVSVEQLRNAPDGLFFDQDIGALLIYTENPSKEPTVTIQFADIPVEPISSVENMVACARVEEDVKFVHGRWGHVLKEKSQFEQGQALARDLIEELEPYRGTPFDPNVAPFQLYRKIVAGEEWVHCGVIAKIFSYAANLLGIKARILQLGNMSAVQSSLSLASCHWVNEIYCEDMKRWCLFDLHNRAIKFYHSGLGVLNLFEVLWLCGFDRKRRVFVEMHGHKNADLQYKQSIIETYYSSINQRFSVVLPTC